MVAHAGMVSDSFSGRDGGYGRYADVRYVRADLGH